MINSMEQMRDKSEELRQCGYCVLPAHLNPVTLEACRHAFWPIMLAQIESLRNRPNRGVNRYFFPVPFTSPVFAPAFFFDPSILGIVRRALGERIVADQWGCDVPVHGSEYQEFHADYARPLFEEAPDLVLPAYMLVVSFGLVPITAENGPIEIVSGSHTMRSADALLAVERGELQSCSIPLELGDVLIRHPWALHRGTPNTSEVPRPLLTIRYVRRWYADASRDVAVIPRSVWTSLPEEERALLRFTVAD